MVRRLAEAITSTTGACIDLTRPALQLSPDPARQFTRCTRCNTRLETVEEAVVRDRLPEGVRDRGQVILHCPSCDQLYWRGSHVDRILAELVP
jgi:hypothetical protein